MGGWSRCRRSGTRGKRPESDVAQRGAQRPSLRQVVLYSYIGIPQLQAIVAKAANHLLNYRIVDEIVESKSIRVLELKFVVIGQETKEVECWHNVGIVLAVLDILHERRKQIAVREVRRQCCVKASSCDGEGGADGLESHGNYVLSAYACDVQRSCTY
jgi:hypothetical protein